MSTAADTFRKIATRVDGAYRALDNDRSHKTAKAHLEAIQILARNGLRDAMANDPKLDAFDGLLAAMETFTDEVEALHRTLGPHRCEDVRPVCPDIDAACAAIAQAKEQTAPDARAQATPRA